MLAETLWAVGGVLAGGYLLLFMLARRPAALRLARLGCLLTALVALRLVLAVGGATLQAPAEVAATVLLGAAAGALLLGRRVWLVRATAGEFREQILTACRGLFLGVHEGEGRYRLAATDGPALRLWTLAARLQLLVLCRVTGPGKVALLCGWLAKQYPGPVPRLRITLKRRTS
jgi:hypothetical protein